jgi:hypothetical protein
MLKSIKTAMAGVAVWALTTPAMAWNLPRIPHHGGPRHPPGGGGHAAPEIDVSQGLAALALVVVAFLVLRELHQRQKRA